MDYEKFKKELEEYDDWERINYNEGKNHTRPRVPGKPKRGPMDNLFALNSSYLNIGQLPTVHPDDRVNSPSHYTRGKQEVIDTIEEAVQDAPTPGKGLLQGQVLKYMLRVWLKDNPLEDLKKAQWYLTRLIDKLEGEQ